VPARDAIQATDLEGLHLISADKNLVGADLELVGIPNREFRLRERIADIREEYRFVLIDCPPALDLLTLNALIAADSVLVPIQCEFFALEGVSELMDTIDRIRDSFQHPLQVEGILLTMYDDRTNLTRQVAADLREFFGDQVESIRALDPTTGRTGASMARALISPAKHFVMPREKIEPAFARMEVAEGLLFESRGSTFAAAGQDVAAFPNLPGQGRPGYRLFLNRLPLQRQLFRYRLTP